MVVFFDVFGPLCWFVCLFVFLSAGLRKNYWPDFHETWCKGVAWAEEETLEDPTLEDPNQGVTNHRMSLVVGWPLVHGS